MNTELVEELFAAIVTKSPQQRQDFVSASKYPQAVKEAATRLVKAYESKSFLLNQDLLSDIARIDPDFFTPNERANDLVLKPGDRVKDYVIESVIGEGGMSVVYRAIQKHPIKRRVALKLIRPSLLAPKTVIRFFREQQALALVGHSNIAALYEVGSTPEGHPFAAMEFVNGLPISTFCEQYRMESRQRTILFLRACEGLMHAHRHGIIHRDVKPDNILVCVRDRQPVAKLIDFGIAKFDRDDLDNNQTMTQVGQVLGSPRYMSPEQFDGKRVGQQTDIYSAALVLFELLTRTPCRNSETTEELMHEARTPEPELLSRRIKQSIRELGDTAFHGESKDDLIKFVKRDLDWIIAKALARDPEQRYPTMQSFIKDLRATLRNQPVSVSCPSTLNKAKRFAVRNRIWIGSAAAVIFVIVSTSWFMNWRNSANELTAARQANTTSEIQTQAANNLIMSLLASEKYELKTEQFEFKLIPIYRTQYERIKASGGPKSRQDKAVYGILAVLYAMSGNFDQADELMMQVTDDAQRTQLQQVREKICSQYAESAKQKLNKLKGTNNRQERAEQQLTLGRCYVVLNMLDEAKSLLKDSIAFFDSNKPGCYESLVARNTLIMIYDKGNESKEKLDLLLETYTLFENNQKVLTTPLGRSAFSYIVETLAEVDVQKYGALRDNWNKN